MLIAVFAALFSAIVLGGFLLIPSVRTRLLVSHAKTAATHGILGTLGLAGYLFILVRSAQTAPPLAWTAVTLTGIGLLLGAAGFIITRHQASPPDLLVTSHVILAGMGALVLVGLVLSASL